ncbi:MAG: hypothetical protein HYX39_10750 [Bacteroidetes bacterium]|nr:hypothetical protein [Bacteroidota bacterium]
MDLKEAIRKEHSKLQTLRIINYVGKDREKFNELFDIFLNGESRLSQCAGWPLSEIAIVYPQFIQPKIGLLIQKLKITNQHPAIPRNILRIFQTLSIPEKNQSELIDICFKFIQDLKAPIAVRAFSITVACNICSQHPELINELVLLLQDLKQHPQPPAIISRIKLAFKQLNLNK